MKRTVRTFANLKGYQHYKERLTPGIGRSVNLLLAEGKGSYLFDAEGKKYLDFTCGIGVTNLGHSHPRLVKVVQNQAAKLWHGQVCLGVHTAVAELIDEMMTILPPQLDNLNFVSTGAEAVEAALRTARIATGRQNVVVVQGGYHGRTNACLALTTSKYSYGIGCKPYMPGVVVTPCPYSTQLKLPIDAPVEEMTQLCVAILDDLIHQQCHPSEIAMLLIEPVMGEGGYLPQPVGYMKALREVCTKHGILLAIDEVQTGFGRTGSMFTFEQMHGVLPDILLFAKGIANGLPLAGMACSSAIAAKCPPGSMGGTYAANALACASAAEVIKIFREDGILENVAQRSTEFFEGLQQIAKRNPSIPILEIRGRGLMIGVQFTPDAPAGYAAAVVNQAKDSGLLLLNTSKFEVLRLIPPLNVSKEQVDEGLAILEKALLAATESTMKNNKTTPVERFAPCCDTPCYGEAGGNRQCRFYAVRK